MVLGVVFALINQTKVLAQVVDIGSITELNGITRVVRDKPYESAIDFSLNSMDRLETAQGRMGVTFQDDTTIKLTEHSNVVIDDFVYNPDQVENSAMALNFIFRYTLFSLTGYKPTSPIDKV